MTFLNPFFLFGLAASALPVLFHLFARKRARRVEFSSLRFLQKLEKTSMRAVKIRQILLLIIRTLLIIAIVLAFARPALRGYLGGFFGSSHANSSIVLLIDNSASMSRSDERGELLKQSREAALSVASLMKQGDDAYVIPLASIQRGKLYPAMHTQLEVTSAINAVRIADRPAQLGDGLRMASASLAGSANINKEVYLFSDNQARNLRGEQIADSSGKPASKLFDASTKLFTMTMGNGDRINGRNLSLDSLKPVTTIFEPGLPINFEAWIRNTSEVTAQNVVISLFYNNERVAQRTIPAISAGTTEHLSIDGPIRGSGILSVRAELEPDALPFDNTQFTVLTIPASRRIGIFMQDPSNASFITLALSQTLSENTQGLPFTTDIKRIEDLRSLSATGDRYDAIMVGLGPATTSETDLQGLKSYVTSGHGASVFLMAGSDPKTLNNDLSRIGLPGINSVSGNVSDQSHYLSFAQLDFAHPFFSGMFERTSTTGNSLHGIESPKIYQNFNLASGNGIPLIKLSNGAPFLTEIKLGKGDAIVYSVPPTLQYSDLPRKSIFLPLIRRTAAYINAVHSQQDENHTQQFVTTEPFEVELPQLAGEQPGTTVLVKAPDGSSERTQIIGATDGKLRIHLEAAKVAGNYTVYRDAEAREPIAAYAVNIQSDESDLRTTSAKELANFVEARMTGSKPKSIVLDAGQKNLAEAIQKSRYGVELWQSFLWAALILAFLEMTIAREAKRVAVST